MAAIRVLLVEDDVLDVRLTRSLMDKTGLRVELEVAGTVAEALPRLLCGSYDLALVDHRLGPDSGVELIQQAREQGSTADFVMLTGADEQRVGDLALDAGAVDFLSKGALSAATLRRVVRYTLARRAARSEMEMRCRTDRVTGLEHREAFVSRVGSLLDRDSSPHGVMLFVDVEGFRSINDAYGHAVGDEVLRVLSARIGRVVGAGAHLARVGADDFAVFVDDGNGQATSTRVSEAAGRPIVLDGAVLQIQVTIGCAPVSAAAGIEGEVVERALAAAEAHMYRIRAEAWGDADAA